MNATSTSHKGLLRHTIAREYNATPQQHK